MSMPQVHIVAYCVDLGYGAQRGAEMLSLMLGFGVVSRVASGMIADKIGGLGTLLLGTVLQCMALFLFLPFDGLYQLYLVSAFFGLAQGGIVPSYALIVRDYFPAREAATRVSLVLMMTVAGMAIGATIALPELLRRGYDKRMVTGVIQAGSSLGILVLPSVVLVLYAMIARQPVGQLWLAGVVPGLMMAGMFVIYIATRCWLNQIPIRSKKTQRLP